MRKVNQIGMKKDYEKNYSLRLTTRCIPTLAMVSFIRCYWSFFDTSWQHALVQCHHPTSWTFI